MTLRMCDLEVWNSNNWQSSTVSTGSPEDPASIAAADVLYSASHSSFHVCVFILCLCVRLIGSAGLLHDRFYLSTVVRK